jgi:hypothetical protein
MPGTTHPPGLFVISYLLRGLASVFTPASLGWGVILTLLNTLLVPLICLLAKELSGERNARLTGLMMVVTPSLALHFCAMIDVLASVFTAAGYLALMICLKNLSRNEKGGPRPALPGLWAGFFFTLAAQMTYGHAIPIAAALAAFVYVARNLFSGLKSFFGGLLIVPVIYFALEYFLSGGASFYPARALKIAQVVKDGLDSRPYPLSQFANLTIMSVMGGVLYAPAMLNSIAFALKSLRFPSRSRGLGGLNFRRQNRQFMSLAAAGIVVFLAFQSTVRLEVERTWHWAFIFGWAMAGICAASILSAVRRLFRGGRPVSSVYLLLGLMQLVLTLALALSIQDYY